MELNWNEHDDILTATFGNSFWIPTTFAIIYRRDYTEGTMYCIKMNADFKNFAPEIPNPNTRKKAIERVEEQFEKFISQATPTKIFHGFVTDEFSVNRLLNWCEQDRSQEEDDVEPVHVLDMATIYSIYAKPNDLTKKEIKITIEELS